MKLRLIDPPTYSWENPAYQPGDCWYATPAPDGGWLFCAGGGRKLLEGEHAPKHAGRRPMIVVLPTGATFVLTGQAWTRGKPYGDGWDIVGELPDVTVTPSINFDQGGVYEWHGWITAGEMA